MSDPRTWLTPVRSKRGAVIHLTADMRETMCRRSCDGWILEPDAVETCMRCHSNAKAAN